MQISHRNVQYALKKALASHKILLEHSFPSIRRVADVVWPAQKIIFEVQCSPISTEEIEARNRDYRKVGYSVIWILHDHTFNRTYLTPAERVLRSQTHYFTDINSFGVGEIYDQHASIRWGRRVKRTPRYPIVLHQLTQPKPVSRHLPKERWSWNYSFGGDLFHRDFQNPKFSIFRLYRFLFQILVEKTTH